MFHSFLLTVHTEYVNSERMHDIQLYVLYVYNEWWKLFCHLSYFPSPRNCDLSAQDNTLTLVMKRRIKQWPVFFIYIITRYWGFIYSIGLKKSEGRKAQRIICLTKIIRCTILFHCICLGKSTSKYRLRMYIFSIGTHNTTC